MKLKCSIFVVLMVASFMKPVWGEGNMEKATFAAGCFWGVEKFFSELPGVMSTQVGYTGGSKSNVTYEEICTGTTGHAEAIEIVFDPDKITYEELLEAFFTLHDCTQVNRQGNDIGTQYRSSIFTHSPEQEKSAQAAIKAIDHSKILARRVATQIEPAGVFWKAEDRHQKYLKKNPNGYCALLIQPKRIADVLRASRTTKN